MITAEQIAIYRCPIDPRRETKLTLEEDVRIVCEGCTVRFRIRDGFPCLVPEDAVLPAGCSGVEDLRCRRRNR
jgi:uncharacterized protein YbaR (Trm112 family)